MAPTTAKPPAQAEPTLTHKKEDVHILVTGFGLFNSNATNPSWSIASSLPPTLPLPDRTIHIHTLPGAIEVSYDRVRRTVPDLLFSRGGAEPNFDLVLHIGMAGKRDYYAVETQAHRDNYSAKDVEGFTLEDARGGTGYWKEMYDAPEVLETGLDTSLLLSHWRHNVSTTSTTNTANTTDNPSPPVPETGIPIPNHALDPDTSLQLSSDAGRYLCEFIYYTSLLEYWRREPKGVRLGERPVVFLHVPGQADEESLGRGRMVAIALIEALVETWEGGGGT